MITFSTTTFFDPFGDGKSVRKVFKRRFYHTDKTKQEIENLFKSEGYFNEVVLTFKDYKRTKEFIR